MALLQKKKSPTYDASMGKAEKNADLYSISGKMISTYCVSEAVPSLMCISEPSEMDGL